MKKLGKFEILAKIGQGAMGVVYKARDPLIGRTVALKTITTNLAESPDLLKRFYGEARSAGRLQHPNIVTIFELGNEGDTPFIAMEFLTGESLDKLIARRPRMPLSQKLGYIVYVCRALEYAHRQNPSVIHRDIKPGNVMVTSDGTVKVVDFGIARLGEGSHSQSSGMLFGTLPYMSPQQFRGGSADARSDIWATGIMLYELLCYHRPFDADNPGTLMTSIMLDPRRPISEAAPGTPGEVEAIVDRMLCKELDGRYQNMDEVLMELEPVWHQMQKVEVSSLVADGRQLFEARDLVKAEDIVRKALQIDTSNTQAKSLLEKINAELRRGAIIHQVAERVENGQNFLSAGQIEEAKAEAEAALRLDSTFQPAKELLDRVQVAAERVRLLTNALRASKQRLAEGALTEAELQLDKVLEMDPKNSAAQDLQKQIRDEKARRERQRRLGETLRMARTYWTNLQYAECINLLLEAEKEFPRESEIARLLHTAREDQAEQQRQSLLSEARKLLNAQRFEETLQALDRLLVRFPSDPTARNLRTLALQGQEQEKREQRLNANLTNLRAMVEIGKYQEVMNSGQKLLEEFPDEFELVELIQFARSEQIHFEQKSRLDEWIKRIQQSVRDERFPVAIQDAQKALKEFPQDVELLILSERAKKAQKDKEREELLRQRLQQVEERIERQELTSAIDLARQTLVTVGPHAGIAKLLHRAEMEFEQRNRTKREQDVALEKARTLIDAGELNDATLMLKNAVETRLFTKSDPRFAPLLDEIDARKQQLRVEAALRELRSLLAAARHSEVIEKGRALLRELPRDVEVRELVEFAQEKISREQQREKEEQCEQEIQSLLEAGRFLNAEEAAIQAAKAYPRQANFHRLLEQARSKKREQEERERLRQEIASRKEEQRRKEEQERQLEAVRTVIEQGNLAEATQLLNRALAAKILERSDAQATELASEIAEKRREIEERRREEQRRKEEQERQVEAVRTVIEQGNFAEATQLLNQALAAKVLERSDARAKQLESEIAEKKREIEERRREEQRRKEEQERRVEAVRTVIEQGNFAEATQLLNQALAAKVLERSDARAKQLESEIAEKRREIEERRREEQRRKEEQERQVEAVRTVIEQGNFAEATQLLNQALAAKVLERSDARAKQLESEIAEKKREIEERRQEEQRRKEEQERRVEAVRTVIEQGNFAEATQLLNRALAAKILERSDVRVKQLLIEIREKETQEEIQRTEEQKRKKELQKQEEKRRKEEAREQSEARRKQEREKAAGTTTVTPRRGRLAMFLATAVVAVAGILYVVLRHWPPPPPSRELVLKQASEDLRKQGKLDEAISKDKEIVSLRGTLVSWANQDLENIAQLKKQQQEDQFMANAKAAEENDDPRAAEEYQSAIDLHGPREAEAKAAKNAVEQRMNAKPREAIAGEFFDRGRVAFDRREYAASKRFFQDSLSRAPEGWDQRKQVQDYLTKTEHVLTQQELLQRAQNDFAAKDYKSAEEQATNALNIRDGDAQFRTQAEVIKRRSKQREEQENIYAQAVKLEQQGRFPQAKEAYERVLQFEDGDEEIAAKARQGIGRTAVVQPPPADYTKVVSEIEGLITSKQFEAAKAKLSSNLPTSRPEYQQLLEEIQNGENQQEEERFSENVKEFQQAEATKNIDLLNRIRPYFAAEASSAGRHHDEANTIVMKIDSLLRPSQPPSPCASEDRSRDCSAIKDLVEVKLSNAFGARNLQELQSLWPALSGQRDLKQKLKATFDGASKFSRRYTITKWDFIGPNEVTVSGSYTGEFIGTDGSRLPGNGHFDIRVVQENGRWVIKDLMF